MLYHNLKNAWRNIIRSRISSVVNITGLALGLCAFLLLMEYISLEKSANTFHKNLPNMYRLINEDPSGNSWPQVEPGWASIVKQRFPEVKDYCRFDEETGNTIISTKDHPDESYSEKNTGYADGNFFSFFSFPLLSGSPSSLSKPDVVFISQSISEKYFGKSDPMDQTLVLNNQFGKTDYVVKGVYADMKDNSDIQYNMLFSLETLKNPANLNGNDWAALDNLNTQYITTFFSLKNNTDTKSLEKKLTALRTELKKDKDDVQFRLQPFADVHLGSTFNDTYPTYANLKYVYMLAGIALLILLIAWFNYINLSTANSFRRANEVGVRKVIGASKKNLVFQFLGESLMINQLALVFAIVLVSLLQPFFNSLVEKHLSLSTITNSATWIYGLLLLLAGSLFSGAYTAFTLSGFNPVETLNGKISKTTKGILLRKSLVVAQFAISVMLIIATLGIYSQLHFMQHKKLGLNPSQLLVIRGPQVGRDSTLNIQKSVFQNELSGEGFVKNFCITGSVPSGNYNFTTSGFSQPGSAKGDELKSYSFAIIDNRFLSTYEIPLVAGRNFTKEECEVKWNDNSKVLINETAAKQLNFQNPEDALKTKVQWDERKLDVIGVVKDYNHTGVQHVISPIIFYPQINSSYFTIRLSAGEMNKKISTLKKLYASNFSGNPFEYFFIDENYHKLYASEMQYGHIFTASSLWAIFIACLGLFGLVTFTVESRIKEIGVRKVLGAGVTSIVSLLSKDFLELVCISLIIATPVAWFFMNKWLDNFAYRIHIGWWVFAAAGGLAIFFALATIGFQAIKAAMANPVKSLRTE
jgi:putative ABC transport system permease protein